MGNEDGVRRLLSLFPRNSSFKSFPIPSLPFLVHLLLTTEPRRRGFHNYCTRHSQMSEALLNFPMKFDSCQRRLKGREGKCRQMCCTTHHLTIHPFTRRTDGRRRVIKGLFPASQHFTVHRSWSSFSSSSLVVPFAEDSFSLVVVIVVFFFLPLSWSWFPCVVVLLFCQGSLKNKSPSNWEHDCDPLRSRMASKHRNLVAYPSDNEQHPKQSHHPRRPAIKSSILPCSTTPEYLHSLKTAIHYVGKLIIMAQRYFGQPPNPCSVTLFLLFTGVW